MSYRRKRSANCENHFRDFIWMIIKNASVLYYKLSFKLGPLSLSTRVENFK